MFIKNDSRKNVIEKSLMVKYSDGTLLTDVFGYDNKTTKNKTK